MKQKTGLRKLLRRKQGKRETERDGKNESTKFGGQVMVSEMT